MDNLYKASRKSLLSQVLSGSLLIAGSAVGAGMLGIPLLTATAGFLPAALITLLVWLFMLATGLVLVEATLKAPTKANLLSLTAAFLGNRGQILAGIFFLFLYTCLLVAYFAAGVPLLAMGVRCLGLDMAPQGIPAYLLFALLFGGIVALGMHVTSRLNLFLMGFLAVTYGLLLIFGSPQVEGARLWQSVSFGASFSAVPVLLSAFGYHNILPSLCHHLEGNRSALRLAVILGTGVALIIYLTWQWLILGAVPLEQILVAKEIGQTASAALQGVVATPWVAYLSQGFAFFAIVTSFLGVAYSMVDFLADGCQKRGLFPGRLVLCFFTLLLPALCAYLYPFIFEYALGLAGGIGEAFLNGLLPVWLVWIARYRKKLKQPLQPALLPGGKPLLLLLAGLSIAAFVLEIMACL